MATDLDLLQEGFNRCSVVARTLNIVHPGGLGPFCRLAVEDTAPQRSGVYAWVRERDVMYIGKATQLRQIVHGARMGRPYNDYTYVPASKVAQRHSPRVRINALLNATLAEGDAVTWWWAETASVADASKLEATLIAAWSPPWNRARPALA